MSKVALVVAGLSAVSGAGLIHVYLSRLEREISGGEKIPVLVAVRDVPVGAVLKQEMLATKEVPAAYVTTRQIEAKDTAQVLGARVTIGLKINDSVEWSDLSETVGSNRDLSSLVQNGSRALSIRAADLFDGLLRPGDRVDVLFTADQSSESGTTSTLLQNLLVLSVAGHTTRDDDAHDGYSDPSSVALSVTPTQAQLLSQAAQHGHLGLVLRNPSDTATLSDLGVTRTDDLHGSNDTAHGTSQQKPKEPRDIEHVH